MRLPATFRSSSFPERKRLFIFLLIAVFMMSAAAITKELLAGELMDFDKAVFLAFRHADNPANSLGPYWLQIATRDITSLGSPAVIGIVTAIAFGFLILKGQGGSALMLLASVAGGSLISHGLKTLIERPRPAFAAEIVHISTYSFPSGHAFLAAVTFLTIGALAARAQQGLALKIYAMGAACLVTLLVGLSRIYLGVHWPTDVVGGWCFGAVWVAMCWSVMNWLKSRQV